MNKKLPEPNKPNREKQESNDSSRSPGVTDRGLISDKASKDSKANVTSQSDKSV
jgi:hypothetical protein